VGDVAAVQARIEEGADLDARDPFGSTPLMIAATFGRAEAAEALLAAGADPDLRNADGGTALHGAAFLCHEEVVRTLLDHGADRYLRDHFGNTPYGSLIHPFEEVRVFYDAFAAGLAPLGLELDYDRIRAARPRVAEMLRPSAAELAEAAYAPEPRGDWPTSTPEAEGLDPSLVAELYLNAGGVETLRSLLVVRHGSLLAEGYFGEGAIDAPDLMQSVTKSVTSALVGLAIDAGCLESVDQPMLTFFPELDARIEDPRKRDVTVRQLLQMRGGFPWEETEAWLWDAVLSGEYVRRIVDVPLVTDPGTAFHYSNLTSNWLGMIVARSCDTDLRTFAEQRLFGPLGIDAGFWRQDADGYYIGAADLELTPRDAARFGLTYLNGGRHDGVQVVPAAWVRDSLQRYTEGSWDDMVFFRDVGYGYQWWSAIAGAHRVDFAWGHGGQLIVLVPDLDMMVVATADPFWTQHDEAAWQAEIQVLGLVSEFVQGLPANE
jgi:CubicO group peptidase (beta-lactamase class C family)